MNSRLAATSALGLLASIVLASQSCAPASDGSPTTGGTTSTGTGGSSTTTGGTSTTGGTGTDTGGTTSTGGTGPSTGGTGPSTGGTGPSTGGTGPSTGGTGPSTGGTGPSTGGTGPSTGGTGPSTGGTGPSTGGTSNGGSGGAVTGGASNGGGGGASGGTTNTGGASTGGASTGGSGAITIATLFPDGPDGSLDGMLSIAPCKEKNTAGTDCTPNAYYKGKASECSGGALDIKKSFNVGGTPGTTYKATLHFYGIAEPKIYGSGVTREASGRPGNSQDGKGATPTPWASAAGGYSYPASDYNTYEIHVLDNTGKETNVYFLNADTEQGHWVYVLNYEKTIPVIGGGKINYRTYDRNCRQIKNCGVNAPNNQCATEANKRVIDVSQAMPTPASSPASSGGLLQPQLATGSDAGNAGQWLLIDVTAVSM